MANSGDLDSLTAEEILQEIRRKWNDKATFKQRNAKLLSELREKAARNAELALELLGKLL